MRKLFLVRQALLAFLLFLIFPLSAWCADEDVKDVDLAALYAQIDEAIAQSPRYVADYERKIREMKHLLSELAAGEQRLLTLEQLALTYQPFNGDSTLAYTRQTLQEARREGAAELAGTCMARMAYLCTFLGSQTEALTLLRRMQPAALNREARTIYYWAYVTVYSNLAANTQLPEMREEFARLHECYTDSLLATAPQGSEFYYRQCEPRFLRRHQYQEALHANTERLNMTQEGTHENAIVAYNRYEIYRAMGNRLMAKYWLCKSAIDDVRNAVMDQAALMELAGMLDAEGDTERASRYISFNWECNRRFSPHMRSWQIAPLLSAIEQNYQAKIDRKNRLLTLLTVGAMGLLAVLALVTLYSVRRRRQMKRMKTEIEHSNEQLAASNRQLAEANEILRMLKK